MCNSLPPTPVRPQPAVVAVDLFAGAGGLSLGALQAGFEVRAAVERSKHACSTYRHNLISTKLSNTKLFELDILELDPAKLMLDADLPKGRCDILIGGPPCQGFSAHRVGRGGAADPRNALLLRYFDFVRALRPKFFLVENVPGMLWPRHREYVDRFYELAREHGYLLPPPEILNARDFGVPQNRRRVFLFGTDADLGITCDWPPTPKFFSPKDLGVSGSHSLAWLTAQSVFDAPVPALDPNDIHMRHGPELTRLFEATPLHGGSRFQSGRQLKCHQGHNGHFDVYGRINLCTPGPTMTTACINPSKGRFVHPTKPHGITLRQAARFQTFPDWFVFNGGLMSCGEQIGNAVPVQMAKALLIPVAKVCQDLHGGVPKRGCS